MFFCLFSKYCHSLNFLVWSKFGFCHNLFFKFCHYWSGWAFSHSKFFHKFTFLTKWMSVTILAILDFYFYHSLNCEFCHNLSFQFCLDSLYSLNLFDFIPDLSWFEFISFHQIGSELGATHPLTPLKGPERGGGYLFILFCLKKPLEAVTAATTRTAAATTTATAGGVGGGVEGLFF